MILISWDSNFDDFICGFHELDTYTTFDMSFCRVCCLTLMHRTRTLLMNIPVWVFEMLFFMLPLTFDSMLLGHDLH